MAEVAQAAEVQAYLRRIGYDGPARHTARALARLQRAHLTAVPFESLDPHFGVPISLARGDLFDKIVRRRRGGFCYELNGLFGWLLAGLGFEVSMLAARPFTGDGGLAPPFAHLVLMVTLQRRWLVDVGFGYWAMSPLHIDARRVQRRGRRRFRIAVEDSALAAEELGTHRRWGYQFDTTPRHLADFDAQCRTYATDPESGFVRNPPVSLAFDDGWLTVTPAEVIGSRGGRSLARPILDPADWKRAVRELLGVTIG